MWKLSMLLKSASALHSFGGTILQRKDTVVKQEMIKVFASFFATHKAFILKLATNSSRTHTRYFVF